MPRSGIEGSLLRFLNTTDMPPPQGLCNCCCCWLAYLFHIINTPHSFILSTFKYMVSSLIILLTLKPLNPYARSYGNSIFFCFLRKLYTVFHSGCPNIHIHSHLEYTRLPFFFFLGGFLFLHTSLALFVDLSFNHDHSDWCEVISQCRFIFL